MGVKAWIFDIDGTLVDSVDLHARAWRDAFGEIGRDIPLERIRGQIGKGGDHLLPVFLPAEELGRVGERVERRKGEIFRARYHAAVKPFPRVRDLFLALRGRGFRLTVATSAKADEKDDYLRIAGVADLTEGGAASDQVENSKPDPDIFAAALRSLRPLGPSQTLAVGDTPYDAEAAAKLGIPCLGLLTGGFRGGDLAAAGCQAIYRDPADLLDHIADFPL